MAQAKIATLQWKPSPNHGKSVRQKTGVGNPTDAIAGVLRKEQTVGRPVLSKYVSIEGDGTGISLKEYRKALGSLALQLTEAEIRQAFMLSDRLAGVLFDMWRAESKSAVK